MLIEDLLHRRTDLSTFIVHFTRDLDGASARSNLLDILRDRNLQARFVHGMAKQFAAKDPDLADTQRTVCFTETPLEHAWMMCESIKKRSVHFNGYGIAFTKTFARRRGANPVWYLDITRGHDWLTNPITALMEQHRPEVFALTPFIEQMGTPSGTRKEFWWEREWRHVGSMSFAPVDVVVVFAPEPEQEGLRRELLTDPNWAPRMPAFVDARWGLERMIGALAGVGRSDLGPFPCP